MCLTEVTSIKNILAQEVEAFIRHTGGALSPHYSHLTQETIKDCVSGIFKVGQLHPFTVLLLRFMPALCGLCGMQ